MSLSAERARELLERDRLVGRLQELVRIDSQNPPGREAEAAELAAAYCRELGFDVSSHEAVVGRPNVVARKRFGAGPVLAYCSHLDTVPIGERAAWARDPLAGEMSDNAMWGRGTADAKGPIAAALEAACVLEAAGAAARGTLELDLVSDEETMGFRGAAYLIEQGIVRPDAVVVGEPTSLRLVRAQRGVCWIDLRTRGRAAHGSAPERGVNAILHMAEVLRHVSSTLPHVTHPVLGGPSLNVGTIRGGDKVNMVAAACHAELDRRTVPGETPEAVLAGIEQAIDRARRTYPDIDAQVSIAFSGDPFEIDEGSRIVTEVSAALEEALGRPAELAGFRGASDARFFATAGSDTIVCGPGDIAVAHTVHEHVDLGELERAALAYALSFARLLGASEPA
jgi:succinyl-diaminopimelate desuccinylase